MSNCLIGNLAISDLLLALTVLPISATNDLLGFWVFGEVMCTFWLCVDVLYCTASIWGLCTVAFDRYMATVYPVWYHDRRSVHKALACIFFVWIFSAVISLAPFIGWRHTLSNFFTFNDAMQRYECVLFTSSSYVLYSAMGSFVIPACLMTFMYIRIFVVLHGKSKIMIKRKLGGRGFLPLSEVPHSNNNHRDQPSHLSNGCVIPELSITPDEQVNGVERDFTTTTLVSVAMGSVENLDTEENKDNHKEGNNLLESPSPQPDPCRLQLPSSVTCDPSISSASRYCPQVRQCIGGNKQVIVGKYSPSPSQSRRSNSLTLPEAPSLELRSHSPHLDIKRRHSHNVAFTVLEIPRDQDTPGAVPHSGLRSFVQRSQSANVLNLRRSSQQQSTRQGGVFSFLSIPLSFPRRSSGCPDSNPGRRLDRNSRLTVSMKRRFEQREQRATKRMLLIMASFCVCWMPFLVMYVMRGVCETCYMNQHLVAAIIWLGYVNSSLNPVLYTLFNDDFKAAFKKMMGLSASPHKGRRTRARGRCRGKAGTQGFT
ncbi:hypothetical protein EGW08_004459 [Elysia chlorotica]|uniref:G-protein coupled receptors family 1 profile domain-containing protein n=1 Tax=Elysia chlorotica TaxID=188477 RepID=A0A3S0ZWK6_ELYCH|nr:hypothetical protein EGW08_004459 [Elysia chlorotica]